MGHVIIGLSGLVFVLSLAQFLVEAFHRRLGAALDSNEAQVLARSEGLIQPEGVSNGRAADNPESADINIWDVEFRYQVA